MAHVVAMVNRNSVCGMCANATSVPDCGGILNKKTGIGLLRCGQIRSKRVIGWDSRGEKEQEGVIDEAYAEYISQKAERNADRWKIFRSADDSKEERKEVKSRQVNELLVHYGGAYLSVVSFALCYALLQAGVDVGAMLQKLQVYVHEGITCQAEQQTMQNKSAVVSKAPMESKDKACTPKLDDGGIGGGQGSGGDGGGGGGGGGGRFLFWGLLMLVGFLRDNESEKPHRQK